jgi:ABC-type phosphate transport system auxiliary subunit
MGLGGFRAHQGNGWFIRHLRYSQSVVGRNMADQLKQRNLLIIQLQNKISTVEKNVIRKVNKGLEYARASDKQEIQQLKTSLDEMHRNVQASEGQSIQQSELVKQL